ncbi:hypothetical protein BST61_g7343 [Cercospora zeina]
MTIGLTHPPLQARHNTPFFESATMCTQHHGAGLVASQRREPWCIIPSVINVVEDDEVQCRTDYHTPHTLDGNSTVRCQCLAAVLRLSRGVGFLACLRAGLWI